MELDAFRREVSRLLFEGYAITWSDTGEGDEYLLGALNAGDTPGAFVTWYAEKRDLISRSEIGL